MGTQKILVIDNTESTCHFTRYVLVNAGFRVLTVDKPEDALEFVTEVLFDAIITDTLSPELEGIEMVRKIRSVEGFEETPILVVSLDNREESKQKGFDAGITDWIAKPISPKKLVEILKQLCPQKDDDMPLYS